MSLRPISGRQITSEYCSVEADLGARAAVPRRGNTPVRVGGIQAPDFASLLPRFISQMMAYIPSIDALCSII